MKRGSLRLALALAGLALAAGILLLVGSCVSHGHVVHRPLVANHDTDFDFRRPPCAPAPRPRTGSGDVLLRYLGVGGVYLEWGGHALLTAPYFSNPSPWRVAVGRVAWSDEAIERGLSGTDLANVAAVLVGHSHYDHLADLPPILLDRAPGASVYVNRSGANMLAAFAGLHDRIVVLEEQEEAWLRPVDRDGGTLPLRWLALRSGHAPHLSGIHFAGGAVDEPWTTWEGRRFRAMREGQPYAFLVDLLGEDGAVRFRIYYLDAAAAAPLGLPPEETIHERAVDLAILVMPSHWLAAGYPEALLERTRTRHVLVIHHEDFFRPREKPLRFVATLTDTRAREFLETVEDRAIRDPRGPEPCTCGPCGAAWTLPLPGEWMRFRASP